jgi:hypothetical protein
VATRVAQSHRMQEPTDIPQSVGPVRFDRFGRQVAATCPREFDQLMRNAGGQWEAGSRRWLIERRRIGPVLRTLRRQTDPLFRSAGVDLDDALSSNASIAVNRTRALL